jgi:hypothetical protein
LLASIFIIFTYHVFTIPQCAAAGLKMESATMTGEELNRLEDSSMGPGEGGAAAPNFEAERAKRECPILPSSQELAPTLTFV